MSSDLAAPPATPTRRGQPLLQCVLVAAAVVVGYLLFQHWWALHGVPMVGRHLHGLSIDVYGFIAEMVPAALFALVLLLWGIDTRHRVAGACGALVVGLVEWGLQELLDRYIFGQNHLSQTTLRAWDWVNTVTIPVLVTIAWGLARRRGTLWWLGVPVAPVLAALHHWATLHSPRWQTWEFRHHSWWVNGLEFLAPIVVACLVCWLLDAATTRRTASAPRLRDAEMQSSA
jgi:hypothetical protein